MYADYTYYVTSFLGNSISEEDFPRLATRASGYIDRITGGKAAAWVQDNPNNPAVKDCCCALAESYAIVETARKASMSESGELQSESVGSYSVSYRSGAEQMQAAEAEIARCCKDYLWNTGLLYRGGVRCVHTTHCHCL